MKEPLLIDRVADTTSHRDRDELDRAIVQLLVEFLDARSVTLYQFMEDGVHRRLLRRAGVTIDRQELGPQSMQDMESLPRLDASRQWLECTRTRQVVHSAEGEGEGAKSFFPVEGRTGVAGLLEIELRESMQSRDAGLVLGVLHILKTQTALLDYGERDTLTGLLNRKTFESRFEKICRDIQSHVQPAQSQGWLGLVDIDHFKSINDTHGHLFGDEVQLLVSQIMQRTVRGGDHLFRFGGEEFVVVLDATGANGAQIAFERIRIAIESHRFPQIGQVTASLGYTAIQRQDAPAICVERADAALYFVKRNGRNGVRSYESLVESGDLTAKDDSGDIEMF